MISSESSSRVLRDEWRHIHRTVEVFLDGMAAAEEALASPALHSQDGGGGSPDAGGSQERALIDAPGEDGTSEMHLAYERAKLAAIDHRLQQVDAAATRAKSADGRSLWALESLRKSLDVSIDAALCAIRNFTHNADKSFEGLQERAEAARKADASWRAHWQQRMMKLVKTIEGEHCQVRTELMWLASSARSERSLPSTATRKSYSFCTLLKSS